MIKLLHKLFNYHKIDELERNMETYRTRNQQLEEELKEYKGYKLKYQVAQLYIDDDSVLETLVSSVKELEYKERLNAVSLWALGHPCNASGTVPLTAKEKSVLTRLQV